MPREPIQIVTLSREYGAGGSQLGLLLGSALAWPVLDRDLAERLGAAADPLTSSSITSGRRASSSGSQRPLRWFPPMRRSCRS